MCTMTNKIKPEQVPDEASSAVRALIHSEEKE